MGLSNDPRVAFCEGIIVAFFISTGIVLGLLVKEWVKRHQKDRRVAERRQMEQALYGIINRTPGIRECQKN